MSAIAARSRRGSGAAPRHGRAACGRTGGRAARAAGFTLLEIMVAFAILALGLTLLIGTLSGATRQVRQAGDASRAALHALSLLDEFGNAPQPGERDGVLEDGRYRWRLSVAPWDDPASQRGTLQAAAHGPRLLRLELRVEWGVGGSAQQLRVSSLRWVVPPQTGAGGGR